MTDSATDVGRTEVDDPTSDERWQAGLDYAMEQFCHVLRVDPKDVTWDAATEELEGDVRAVIGNILRTKYGEDFDPKSPTAAPDLVKAAEAILEIDPHGYAVAPMSAKLRQQLESALTASKGSASSRSTGEA